MCGITGIIAKDNKAIDKQMFRSLNDLVSHRGPDSEGFFFQGNVALGHRRLSILDLSDDGIQPMQYQDKFTISYNGEIYNYIEIREELKGKGYYFKSGTDTEVILASYAEWGTNCVQKFNGMWAFAIHDNTNNTIFLSRDRFGIKPLYYCETDHFFAFGSEIKQLLPLQEKRKANIPIVLDYLMFSFEDHTDQTFFTGINKLDQSHNLIFDLEKLTYKIEKYYDLTGRPDEKTSVEDFRSTLNDAIKLRMRSDVKVGTSLSGGLDSSIITAIASREWFDKTGVPFTAIHAKSTQKSSDESQMAEEVAIKSKASLVTIVPIVSDFRNYLDEVIYTQEEPFGSTSIFMQYFLMSQAKEKGCIVMLDGQGGDEILLGYPKYFGFYLKSLPFFKIPKALAGILKNTNLNFFSLAVSILFFSSYLVRSIRIRKKFSFIKKEIYKKAHFDFLKKSFRTHASLDSMQISEIYSTQLPHLLKYEDKNSMRHSIETRLPFLDYRVIECALSLPYDLKIKDGWTKFALREMGQGILPDGIVWRKDKMGFESPQRDWIKNMEKIMKEEVSQSLIIKHISVNSVDIRGMSDTLKWKLYNIARWERLYNVEV